MGIYNSRVTEDVISKVPVGEGKAAAAAMVASICSCVMPIVSVASVKALPEGSTRAIRPPDSSPSNSSFSQLYGSIRDGDGDK